MKNTNPFLNVLLHKHPAGNSDVIEQVPAIVNLFDIASEGETMFMMLKMVKNQLYFTVVQANVTCIF